MEIDASIIGAKSKPYTITTTPRMTMNFAAAIPHNNPHFFQDNAPEGIIAPPTLPVVFFWHMTVRHTEFWDSDVLTEDLVSRLVHYSESLELFRPIVPHEDITIVGEVKALIPHRAGTHIVICYEGRSAGDELIFREYTGGMLRGVQCAGQGEGADTLPSSHTSAPRDHPLREVTLHIDPLAAHRYDGCADIHFPIHTSVAFAIMVGLPEPILHGTCTLGLALREIIEEEGEGNPRNVTAIQAEFTDMVYLDQEIKIQILDKVDEGHQKRVHFQVLNHKEKKAIRNGCVSFTE